MKGKISDKPKYNFDEAVIEFRQITTKQAETVLLADVNATDSELYSMMRNLLESAIKSHSGVVNEESGEMFNGSVKEMLDETSPSQLKELIELFFEVVNAGPLSENVDSSKSSQNTASSSSGNTTAPAGTATTAESSQKIEAAGE